MSKPSVVGTNVRRLRLEAKPPLSQEQLAERAKLSGRVYIAKLETGVIRNPGIDVVGRLAAALGVTTAELLEEPAPAKRARTA